MTERKRNPEEILEDMINKNVKFQVLEIAAGIGAAAGTLAILAKQSALYAAAPLTLAVALNYFNRRRLDQLTRQQTLLDITEVQRRLSSEIQGVRGRSADGSGDVGLSNTEQVENAIASLSETVAALEVQIQQGAAPGGADVSHLSEEIVQLRNHQLDLSQSLEAFNQQLRNLSIEAGSGAAVAAYDPTPLEGEIAALKASIAQLSAGAASSSSAPAVDLDVFRAEVKSEVQSLVTPLQHHLGDLESRLVQSANSGSEAPAPIDVEPLRAELIQLVMPVQQQLASLEERVAAQPVSSATVGNPEEIQSVKGEVSSLNAKLENIAAQLSAEIAGFQQSIEQTQDRVQAVHQSVQDSQVNAAVATPDPASIQQEVQAALSPLQAQIEALESQLGSLPKVDPSLSQLQSEQLISLQNQLNSTNGLIEEVAEQVTAELSKIPNLIDEKVDHKVATLPVAAPPQDKKQGALSELDAILADIM